MRSYTGKWAETRGKLFLTIKELETWLSTVDKSDLPGQFKASIYQHGILPCILWPLLVFEVTMSTVEPSEGQQLPPQMAGPKQCWTLWETKPAPAQGSNSQGSQCRQATRLLPSTALKEQSPSWGTGLLVGMWQVAELGFVPAHNPVSTKLRAETGTR